jgi:DNA-binding winged helix-turn-helix (wHTH) protein
VRVRFAGCSLDTDAHRLWRGTSEVHLSPKAFEMLKVLVENRHRALSKEEALGLVWPGVFVSDASLARVVSEIREGLGDRARHPRILRTVHGYGYAFLAEVEVEDPGSAVAASGRSRPATCCLTRDNRTFPLCEGLHVVGREADASVWLDSPKVSRQHARIIIKGTDASIEDAGSKNGTFVGDERVVSRTPLRQGDAVRIGPFTLVFRVISGPFTTEAETVHR